MSLVKAPYSGPYYGPSDTAQRGPDRGPYIIALKRALSRWSGGQDLKWQEFNATYNLALERAVESFKTAKRINTPKYVWGQHAHQELLKALRKKGQTDPQEPAIDSTAVILMEDAFDLKFPHKRELEKVRNSIADYLERMENNKNIWHYRQQRPMKSIGVAPETGGTDDCSSLVVTACYWARIHTGIFVPDPSGYAYRGYGNTVSIYLQNKDRRLGTSAMFEVGDAALYGPFASRHTVICRRRGTASTAIWTSHGSDAGPYACSLFYRSDLFSIVRPILSP